MECDLRTIAIERSRSGIDSRIRLEPRLDRRRPVPGKRSQAAVDNVRPTSNTVRVSFSRNRHSLEREKKEQRAVSRPTEQLCRVCQISEARSPFRDKCSATRRSSGLHDGQRLLHRRRRRRGCWLRPHRIARGLARTARSRLRPSRRPATHARRSPRHGAGRVVHCRLERRPSARAAGRGSARQPGAAPRSATRLWLAAVPWPSRPHRDAD